MFITTVCCPNIALETLIYHYAQTLPKRMDSSALTIKCTSHPLQDAQVNYYIAVIWDFRNAMLHDRRKQYSQYVFGHTTFWSHNYGAEIIMSNRSSQDAKSIPI